MRLCLNQRSMGHYIGIGDRNGALLQTLHLGEQTYPTLHFTMTSDGVKFIQGEAVQQVILGVALNGIGATVTSSEPKLL